MFEFVRTHNRLFQVLLFLLIFPSFVFLGLEGYLQSKNHDAVVARVGSSEITQSEWDQALRTQTERMHQQMPTLPTELFNTPSFRRQTLDDLVRQRVMLQAADRLRLYTTDTHLQSVFAADPQFEFLRNADKTINRTALAAQGMSAEQFEARLRQDISMQQVLMGVAGSSIAPTSATDAALDAMFQQREVRIQRFAVKDYAGKINPSDADVQKFYDDPAHEALFKAPESADIQYVMLDLNSVKAGITVPEEELRKNYEQNKSRYVTPEERRASHILIKADKSMSAEDRAKAKAQAEQLLAEVRKNPKSFAELAKKYSADTGSAEKGGDLGFFGRGAMVKPFEEVAFSLKQGEVSGLVQSDFGYHIIMLTAIKPAQERTYEQVRPELLEQARTQLAQQKFAEVAEQFTNTVYEQSDSLQPVADKLKLPIRTAQNVGRSPAAGASAPLNNSKFVNALFGDDALRNKRNTEAVEIGPNQLVSGRITAYRPARKLPFAEVKAKARDSLVAQEAAEMARKDGEARLAQLKEGKAGTAPVSGDAKVISRAHAQGLPADVISKALAADTAKLPAYVGVNVPGEGYDVVQVDKVLARDPKEADPAAAKAQYAQIFGAAEVQAYYAALKTRQKAEITEAAKQPAGDQTPR